MKWTEGLALRLLEKYSASLCTAGLIILSSSTGVWAQNVVSPAVDWNGNYTFTSTTDRNLRLLQADMIEKKEQGYYESLGKITQNINNTTITKIGQNTNAIGAVNNSTNNINLNGNNNNIDISNLADSTGCQDGSINIGEGTTSIGSSGCQ